MPSIADHLRALVGKDEIPTSALAALVERIDEAAPPLRAVLTKAADGKHLSDDEAAVFFYGLHVLAAGRDTQAFQPLLRFLRRPSAEIDDLLGNASAVTLPRVIAGVFDGEIDALLAAITDTKAQDYVRDALMGAAVFLTFDGRIAADRMRAFLVAFEATPGAPDGDTAWIGWLQAIALLGLRELAPLATRVFAGKRLPPESIEWTDFEEALRDAERAPADGERFEAANLGYMDDVVAALHEIEEDYEAMQQDPIVNPNRDVGRNDPCPCGSGKKFKKCCLVGA